VLVSEVRDRFQSQSRWQQSVSRSLHMLKAIVSDTSTEQKFEGILGRVPSRFCSNLCPSTVGYRRSEDLYSHITMVTFGNSVMVIASATLVLLTLYTVVTSAVIAIVKVRQLEFSSER